MYPRLVKGNAHSINMFTTPTFPRKEIDTRVGKVKTASLSKNRLKIVPQKAISYQNKERQPHHPINMLTTPSFPERKIYIRIGKGNATSLFKYRLKIVP